MPTEPRYRPLDRKGRAAQRESTPDRPAARTVTAITRRLSALILTVVAALCLAGPLTLNASAAPSAESKELSYTKPREAISRRTVKTAELYTQQGIAELTMRDGAKAEATYPVSDQELAGKLSDAGAQVEVHNAGSGPSPLTMIPIVLMVVMLVVAIAFTMSRNGGPGGISGRPRKNAKGGELEENLISDVRFCDVAG